MVVDGQTDGQTWNNATTHEHVVIAKHTEHQQQEEIEGQGNNIIIDELVSVCVVPAKNSCCHYNPPLLATNAGRICMHT